MALDSDLVFLWPGTHATIPAGWERDTRFDDGMYLKAAEAAADPTTGGAATHTHADTSTSHTHTMAGGATSGDDVALGAVKGFATDTHTHASANSSAATFSGAATNNDPPYYDMIFVKPAELRYGYPAYGAAEPDVVAQWLFDEASGSLMDEVSGITLAPQGTPTYGATATGKFVGLSPGVNTKSVAYFIKTTDTPSAAIGTSDFTIEGWFRAYSADQNVLLSTGNLSDNAVGLSVFGDVVRLDLAYGGSTFSEDLSAPGAADGNLHKVRLSADRSGMASLYLDETLTDSVDISSAAAWDFVAEAILAAYSAETAGCDFFEVRLSKNATNNSTPVWVDTAAEGCPNSACAMWDDTSLPTDWTEHAGSKTYLLRGAASGGNAGGTGGNSTHTHNTDHGHAAGTSGNSSAGGTAGGTGVSFARHIHTHQVTLASGSANVGTASTEPEWYKLRVVQNGTGAEDLPDQVIALWLGNHADIPTSWSRVTGPDGVLLKCASNDGEVGDTGGAQTHTHAGANHNHSGSAGGPSGTVLGDSIGAASRARDAHGHAWTIGNASVGLTANSSKSHYPLFQEAIFVQYTAPSLGPPPQLSLLGVL